MKVIQQTNGSLLLRPVRETFTEFIGKACLAVRMFLPSGLVPSSTTVRCPRGRGQVRSRLALRYSFGTERLIRTLIAVAACCSLVLGVAGNQKTAAKASPARAGVKTPGVQIPFASLTADADITTGASGGNPGWLFFSGSLYVPAGDSISSIAKVDPKSNKAAGDPIAGLSQPCGGMVEAFGSLWSPQCGNGSLVRIDPKTLKVTATINSGASHARGTIATTADSIWLLTDDKTTLSRIDPDQNVIVDDVRLMAGCQSLTFAEKSLWVACPSRDKVLRINPGTNVVEEAIAVSAQPVALAAGAEGAVWVLCRKDGKLDRIDSKTDKVAKTIELNVPDADGTVAFGEGWLWVTQKGFPLARIDAKLETVVQQFHGAGGGGAMILSKGTLWLGTTMGVTRIDPKRVIATLPPE
jgi:virginiamycin B lyase